ncbi:2-phosphosulfolactate phosphatase [Aldersonia kunmingensis]|uniref:2-phosphosulfolactate phosphatase n=1 Tax=Aldersonia kunmingensis TaxID=408066 RepID=UPI00082DA86E|nr:2-phosphosulfolactate phosphatase [Aldersonia kunmingensis]
MNPQHHQRDYRVRFDWGLPGAAAVTSDDCIAVVVDVLSFTTTLSVAADLGVEVLPYRWRDDNAAEFATAHDAVLAVGRREAGPGEVSLSPATVRAARGLRRLVLPSPNGSTIAHSLASVAGICAGASLRNALAVAGWIAEQHNGGTAISVIAAGERWPDGSLRPAVEDLWGAGAVIAELNRLLPDVPLSPEAEMATAAWYSVTDGLESALHDCASGRELIVGGYAPDVAVAAELDSSRSVPVLVGESFLDRGSKADR